MQKDQIKKTLIEYFQKKDLAYKSNEGENIIRSSFKIGNKLGVIDLETIIRDNMYVVIAEFPLHVYKEKTSSISEYVLRANWGMIKGCFDFEVDDGKIIFRYTNDLHDTTITDDEIEDSLYLPLSMMQQYGDGFLEVIVNNKSPKEVINAIENSSEETNPQTVHA